jgi:acetyl esterase/lipase
MKAYNNPKRKKGSLHMTKEIKLWETRIPYYIGAEEPSLAYYAAEEKRGRAAVIICPGGGYAGRADYEGKDYAEYLNCIGLDAFVLNYRVGKNKYPAALSDIRRAVRYVRYHADRFGIEKGKIIVVGSSAGGHLAAQASCFHGTLAEEVMDEIDQEDYAPNGQILCYPVMDVQGHRGSFENLAGDRFEELWQSLEIPGMANEKTPPAFIWHTADDACVDVGGSYRYAARLHELNVPVEMHVFPFGEHGLGLATRENKQNPHITIWAELMKRWLVLFGFLG